MEDYPKDEEEKKRNPFKWEQLAYCTMWLKPGKPTSASGAYSDYSSYQAAPDNDIPWCTAWATERLKDTL